jgi:hypothetical protein
MFPLFFDQLLRRAESLRRQVNMSAQIISLVNELTTLFERPASPSDSRVHTEALRLCKLLLQALQKPEDAALELMWSVRCN